jgi:hypothetical protein
MTEENNKLGRRKLLKSAAITGAGTIAGAAGVNSLAPMVLPEEIVFEPNHSHWAKALPPANPPLHADLEAGVAVIGGGFTGLSTAFHLRKNSADQKIVLLEASGCGNGASGRNGAMLLTLTEDRYMQWSGDPALDKKIYDLTVDNIHALGELSKATSIDCELEQKGVLQVCNNAEIDQSDHARAHLVPQRRPRAGLHYSANYFPTERSGCSRHRFCERRTVP